MAIRGLETIASGGWTARRISRRIPLMSTTTTPLATLFRELHRLRRHTRDLQDQIERGPRVLQAHQTKITRQQEALHDAQEALKHLKVVSHQKEGSLKEKHLQIAKYEEQRNKATTRKEYDTLQAEIAAAKNSGSKIEDEILEAMGQVEEQAARIPVAEKEVQRAREEYAEFESKTQERLKSQRELLAQTQEQIKTIEASLPAEVRPVYERLVSARGEEALATVEGRTCNACYTEITAQMHNDLLAGRLVLCKSCGRLLYLPE
jgi:predicted  nucleic acid-binding Zn-ribbon protein